MAAFAAMTGVGCHLTAATQRRSVPIYEPLSVEETYPRLPALIYTWKV